MKKFRNTNYFISETGKISGLRVKELKHSINTYGYPFVTLYYNGKRNVHLVHRILAEVFIPNPENLPEINHKDGNKANYTLENLEWCTSSQNQQHAVDTGLQPSLKGISKSFTEEKIRKVCELMQQGYRDVDIVKTLGTTRSLPQNIRKGMYSQISKEYSIDVNSSRENLSTDSVKWVCAMLQKQTPVRAIVRLSTNKNITRSKVKSIKERKTYIDISKNYKF